MKLTDLFEEVAQNIREVSAYINNMKAPDEIKAVSKKLCAELIKRRANASYAGDGGILQLFLTDDIEGASYVSHTFVFPNIKDTLHKKAILKVTCTAFKGDGTGSDSLYQVIWNYSAGEILAMGLQQFLDAIYRDVRKIK